MFPKRGDLGIFDRPAPIGFIFEPKLDGIRVFLYKDQENIIFVNSLGIDISFKFPELHQIAYQIRAKNCVLDGIITIIKENQVQSNLIQDRELAEQPASIQNRSKRNPATFFVFDVLEVEGTLMTKEWLKVRKQILSNLIEESDLIKIIPSTLNGRSLWMQIKQNNNEGLIVKNSGSKYESGINWSWLKLYNKKFTNAIVAGYTDKSWILGTYRDNVLTYFGEVKKENNTILNIIKTKIKTLKTNDPEHFKIPGATLLKPQIIAKVKFDAFEEGVLKNPEILRIRLDKLPYQCVFDKEL